MGTMTLPVRRVLKEINNMISFLVSDSLINDYNQSLVQEKSQKKTLIDYSHAIRLHPNHRRILPRLGRIHDTYSEGYTHITQPSAFSPHPESRRDTIML